MKIGEKNLGKSQWKPHNDAIVWLLQQIINRLSPEYRLQKLICWVYSRYPTDNKTIAVRSALLFCSSYPAAISRFNSNSRCLWFQISELDFPSPCLSAGKSWCQRGAGTGGKNGSLWIMQEWIRAQWPRRVLLENRKQTWTAWQREGIHLVWNVESKLQLEKESGSHFYRDK